MGQVFSVVLRSMHMFACLGDLMEERGWQQPCIAAVPAEKECGVLHALRAPSASFQGAQASRGWSISLVVQAESCGFVLKLLCVRMGHAVPDL